MVKHVGENVGEKTGEKVGESLGDIDNLNLCHFRWFSTSLLHVSQLVCWVSPGCDMVGNKAYKKSNGGILYYFSLHIFSM